MNRHTSRICFKRLARATIWNRGWTWEITVNALRSHCQPRPGAIVFAGIEANSSFFYTTPANLSAIVTMPTPTFLYVVFLHLVQHGLSFWRDIIPLLLLNEWRKVGRQVHTCKVVFDRQKSFVVDAVHNPLWLHVVSKHEEENYCCQKKLRVRQDLKPIFHYTHKKYHRLLQSCWFNNPVKAL